jgi:hypothetical protein
MVKRGIALINLFDRTLTIRRPRKAAFIDQSSGTAKRLTASAMT